MAEIRTQATVQGEFAATIVRQNDEPGSFTISLAQRVASIDDGPYTGSEILDSGATLEFSIREDGGDPVRVILAMRELFALALVARDKA